MTAKTPRSSAATAALALLLAAPAAADHLTSVRLSLANRLPSTDDRVGLTVSGSSPGCPVSFTPPKVEDRTVRLDGTTIVSFLPCPPSAWSEEFALSPLAAGGYTVEVWIDGTLHLEEGFAVQAAGNTLSFHGGAFTAGATWTNPYGGGGTGEGHAIQLGDDSGAFWFFAPGNVEVTIKVLDGRKFNGRFWVFIANMSTVEFEISVTECPTGGAARPCRHKAYRNPPFENRNFLDTAAF